MLHDGFGCIVCRAGQGSQGQQAGRIRFWPAVWRSAKGRVFWKTRKARSKPSAMRSIWRLSRTRSSVTWDNAGGQPCAHIAACKPGHGNAQHTLVASKRHPPLFGRRCPRYPERSCIDGSILRLLRSDEGCGCCGVIAWLEWCFPDGWTCLLAMAVEMSSWSAARVKLPLWTTWRKNLGWIGYSWFLIRKRCVNNSSIYLLMGIIHTALIEIAPYLFR